MFKKRNYSPKEKKNCIFTRSFYHHFPERRKRGGAEGQVDIYLHIGWRQGVGTGNREQGLTWGEGKCEVRGVGVRYTGTVHLLYSSLFWQHQYMFPSQQKGQWDGRDYRSDFFKHFSHGT
jgi:hypothetical protein